jgi:uncharacterized protein YoaH (UPF0181 family)
LDNCASRKRLPGFKIAKLLAEEAGISSGEALDTLAEEKKKLEKQGNKKKNRTKRRSFKKKHWWAVSGSNTRPTD